jgi:hypothetical protein
VRRFALAIIVALSTFSASGAFALVIAEPCMGYEQPGQDDGACPPICVTCGCCAQAVEPVAIVISATPDTPIDDIRTFCPTFRALLPATFCMLAGPRASPGPTRHRADVSQHRGGHANRLRLAASAYYRALHANERIKLLNARYELASGVYLAADRRFKAGDIAVLDVNIARASLARVRAAREGAEASKSIAPGDVRQLLGLGSAGGR